MSATIPIEIYKKLYGDRIEVVDIRDVKQMGSVIQYTKRSCSRNSLNRYSSIVSKEIGENQSLLLNLLQINLIILSKEYTLEIVQDMIV